MVDMESCPQRQFHQAPVKDLQLLIWAQPRDLVLENYSLM